MKMKESGLNIMLVDDDTTTTTINEMLIRKAFPGNMMQIFNDPLEAVHSLKAGRSQPDLILLDMNMPKMNGWQFLDHLEKMALPEIRVVILTSSTEPEDLNKAKLYPQVLDYWLKPLGVNALRGLLEVIHH